MINTRFRIVIKVLKRMGELRRVQKLFESFIFWKISGRVMENMRQWWEKGELLSSSLWTRIGKLFRLLGSARDWLLSLHSLWILTTEELPEFVNHWLTGSAAMLIPLFGAWVSGLGVVGHIGIK